MSCIPVVVPGNIVPTPEPVQPSASSRGSLDPPLAWVLRSGAKAVCQNCGARTHPSSGPQWGLAFGFCSRQHTGSSVPDQKGRRPREGGDEAVPARLIPANWEEARGQGPGGSGAEPCMCHQDTSDHCAHNDISHVCTVSICFEGPCDLSRGLPAGRTRNISFQGP